jgi:hypothetical protein
MELPPMSSAEGSPARTSAAPARALGSTESVPAYGPSSPVSLASYDRGTRSWKTSQHSLFGGFSEFSETLPRSGMTRNGTVFQLPTLAHVTDEIESGLWPTPAASVAQWGERPETWLARREEIKAKKINGNGMGMPLTIAVQMWPTPNAGDYKAGMSNSPNRQQSSLPRTVGIVEGVSSGKRGGLNPTWVEWLMGFPLKWTVCEAWETQLSRKSRKRSGGQS